LGGPSRFIRIFRPAGTSAGWQTAQYLHQRGHCTVAYISHVHKQLWSVKRLSGMQQFFRNQAAAGAVVPIVVDNIEPVYNNTFWAGSLNESEAEMIERIRTIPFDVTGLREYLAGAEWQAHFNREQRLAIEEEIKTLGLLARHATGRNQFNALRDSIIAQVTAKRNAEMYEQLFSRALEHGACSAWVAANDGLAMHAINFLKRNTIAVPAKLSVCGFDNVHSAGLMGMQLTSYDFNVQGIAHRMLWYIHRFDDRQSRNPVESEEVAGMIIERESTGRCSPITQKRQENISCS
jgi:DNA-binding LacI/PurR family transcriptional regulator